LQKWSWKKPKDFLKSGFKFAFLILFWWPWKSLALWGFLLLISSNGPKASAQTTPTFRLTLYSEPQSLKLHVQKNSNSLYLLNQLYRPLLRLKGNSLVDELAERCLYQNNQKILCKIKKNINFSDGSIIKASDIVESFRNFIDPNSKTVRADLLFSVKNAEEIFSGKKPVTELGIRATADDEIVFELAHPDSEFVYLLANPLLSIQKNELFTGPYVIKEWPKAKSIILKRNIYYWKKNLSPVEIEFRFVNEDSVSLNLYEMGKIDLVRRISTLFIPKLKNRKDYFEIDQYRFDYLGFSSELDLNVRQALSQSLPFDDFQKLYYGKPRPGCPGIPAESLTEADCIITNIPLAQKALSQSMVKTDGLKLKFVYSKLGGDNHSRTAEWLQWIWKKNLGISVAVEGVENKLFLELLKSNPPMIFRKGISPERPTCLSALEIFAGDHPENYLKIDTAEFRQWIKDMNQELDPVKKSLLCKRGINYLLSNYFLVPTGPIFFSLLVNTKWTGWELNQLNNLDLSELKFNPNN
jgi:oligopeptide transport system substrate-binding protein